MKHFFLSFLFVLTIHLSLAQVEFDKVKNTLGGKSSTLTVPMDRVMLDNFQLTFVLLGGASDQAGSGVGTVSVGVRASLDKVDEALAQEITDEAYAYFVEQWKKRGSELYSPTKADLEASKKYSKAAEKGQGQIRSGVTIRNTDEGKSYNNLVAWPSGTNIAFSGTDLLPMWGNSAHLPPDFKGNFFGTAFNSTINFIDFNTAKLGSTASVKGNPQLIASNSIGVTVWEKTKFGVYSASQAATGISEYYDDVTQEQKNILNSQFNFWNYQTNREKYKTNVLEMVKGSMDAFFADLDAVIAKEKG